MSDNIQFNKEWVNQEYKAAVIKNKCEYERKVRTASKEYTFENQRQDAENIVDILYKNPKTLVLNLTKRTKVGMNGIIIEIFKNCCTHPDDNFVMAPQNVKLLSPMNNLEWQESLKSYVPGCFRYQIYHRGILQKQGIREKLKNLKNGLIIIDEIDVGNGKANVLYKELNRAGLCDKDALVERNIRIIIVSATSKQEQEHLERWDKDIYESYKLTIPSTYISHKNLMDFEVIQEYYPINSVETANKWIKEDIIGRYGKNNGRMNIIRVTKKNIEHVKTAAKENNIVCREHNSHSRIDEDTFTKILQEDKHIIIIIKDFWRRANLIPNQTKIKLGALMDFCGKNKQSISCVIQSLSGRVTGYWPPEMLEPDYIKPIVRTCIKSVKIYEEWFETQDHTIKGYNNRGNKEIFLKPEIFTGVKTNIDIKDDIKDDNKKDDVIIQQFKELNDAKKYFMKSVKTKFTQTGPRKKIPRKDGFINSTIRGKASIRTYEEVYAERKAGLNEENPWRFHACYNDKTDKNTLIYVIIHYEISSDKLYSNIKK